MNFAVSFRGNFGVLSQCSSCCDLRFQPLLASPSLAKSKRCRLRNLKFSQLSRRREIVCRVTETETESDSNNEKEKEENEGGENPDTTGSAERNDSQIDPQPVNVEQIKNNGAETIAQGGVQEDGDVEVTSGSPLPGVKVIMMLYYFLYWNLQERSSFAVSSFSSSYVSSTAAATG
ncbi:hypothetical protein QQP08_005026 [Theobroma cacao]|nr:hypothetical protein QQP08_005026 [Theobroma cacao]